MNYYNENDPKAAAWLRELIRAGHIPKGVVDERSIIDVKPHELTKYTQQHFFAGIGGWSLALKLAGWPEERPVRTGSCPCQPFSVCGNQEGTADARHLWPHFRDLIAFGESATAFGEQVASPLGREWLSGVRADLEGLGYEVGACDLCAASISAPHIRQRLYWVAHPKSGGLRVNGRASRSPGHLDQRSEASGMAHTDSGECRRITNGKGCERDREASGRDKSNSELERSSAISRLADATCQSGSEHEREQGVGARRQAGPCDSSERGRTIDGMGESDSAGRIAREPSAAAAGYRSATEPASGAGGVADMQQGLEGHAGNGDDGDQSGWIGENAIRPATLGSWSVYEVVRCTDGKTRRFESGSFPLVASLPSGMMPSGDPSYAYAQATAEFRVVRLKGYGNAIVPTLAAEFIQAYLES